MSGSSFGLNKDIEQYSIPDINGSKVIRIFSFGDKVLIATLPFFKSK